GHEPRAGWALPDSPRPGGWLLGAGGRAVRGRAGVLIMRRSLGVALWTLVGLVACVFGALSALVGTHRGGALLARAAEAGLKRVFSGSVEVGNVSGALLTGLPLSDVGLLAPDTTLVAWLPRAQLSYDPFDLVAGRLVRVKLRLRQPVI